jgi:hypothetical protein
MVSGVTMPTMPVKPRRPLIVGEAQASSALCSAEDPVLLE